MKDWFRNHSLFVVFVLIPNILAIIYFGMIASDVFISESRFIVRSPQKPVQSGFVGQLLQSSGISHSQDDSYAVRDYILSRDAPNVQHRPSRRSESISRIAEPR
jgi:capsular polysaccharide transport system permease protein